MVGIGESICCAMFIAVSPSEKRVDVVGFIPRIDCCL